MKKTTLLFILCTNACLLSADTFSLRDQMLVIGSVQSEGGAYRHKSHIVLIEGTAIQGEGYSVSGQIWGVAAQSPNAPILTLQPTNGLAVLTWTDTSGRHALQETADLDNPVWKNCEAAPEVTDNHYSVSLPMTGEKRFFRLHLR